MFYVHCEDLHLPEQQTVEPEVTLGEQGAPFAPAGPLSQHLNAV